MVDSDTRSILKSGVWPYVASMFTVAHGGDEQTQQRNHGWRGVASETTCKMERGPSVASFCVNPGALRYEVARKLDVFRRPGARRGPMKKRPTGFTTRVDRSRIGCAAAREPGLDSFKVSLRGGLSDLIWEGHLKLSVVISYV